MTDTISPLAPPYRLMASNPSAGAADNSPTVWIELAGLQAAIQANLLANRMIVQTTFNAQVNAVSLLGRMFVDATVPGVLATDRLLELQPTADLPGNLGISQARVTGANTIRIGFSTPVLYIGNTSVPFVASLFRVAT